MTCEHGFDKPSQCVECMLDAPVVPPAKWATVGDAFAAKFHAVCSCGEPIAKGAMIQRWDYGKERSVYLHVACKPGEGQHYDGH